MSVEAVQSLKLASASTEIKIWDASDFSLCYSFTSDTAHSFRTTHWSYDLRHLISVPSRGTQIMLTLVKPTTLQQTTFDTNEENTVAQFGNTSNRFVAVGSKVGKILVWDLKLRKAFKTLFNEKSEVTCLQFNWNDSYITSGFSSGTVTIHNVISQNYSSFICQKDHSVQSLRYSTHKKSLIGCAAEDGAVSLWDANSRQKVHRFLEIHEAPATGLCFSPVNSLLLVSVGLDKNISLYDIQAKQAIRTTACDVPLTSVDLMEDGVTMAVGTMKGSLLVFDLRRYTYPVNTVPAHSSSVSSVSFQNSHIGAAMKERLSKLNESTKLNIIQHNEPISNNTQLKKDIQSPSTNSAINDFEKDECENDRGSLTTVLFSPIGIPQATGTLKQQEHTPLRFQDGHDSHSDKSYGSDKKSGNDSFADVFSPLRKSSLFVHDESSDSPMFLKKYVSPMRSIVSPIRPTTISDRPGPSIFKFDRTSAQNKSEKFSCLNQNLELKPPGGVDVGSLQQPSKDFESVSDQLELSIAKFPKTSISKKQERVASSSLNSNFMAKSPVFEQNLSTAQWPSDKPAVQLSSNCMSDLSCLTLKGMCSPINENAIVGVNDSDAKNFNFINGTCDVDGPVMVTPPSFDDCKPFDLEKTDMTECLKSATDPFPNGVDFIDEGRGTGGHTTPLTPQTFQSEYVRQLIMDAMEDHTDVIRRDFHTYHVQLVRHLERQREEMERLFLKYMRSVNG